MQTLAVYQSLWAMEQRQPGVVEKTAADNFAMIAEAGYAGVCLDPAVDEIDAARKLRPLFDEHGLGCMLNVFPTTIAELHPLLELAAEMNASLVNIIGQVMPVTVDDAVPVARQWLRDSAGYDFPVLFETHRDSLLNDLYYTLQLIERVPDMRLCADLSHFVVDREMRMPPRAEDQEFIRVILERSDCFQGRIASREQIQVQPDFPQHRAWADQFRGWWRLGMQSWRERNADDATLVFLCELGPPPYAMTDATGKELSDRWREANLLRQWAEDAWSSAGQ